MMTNECEHKRAYDPDGDTCCYDCGKVLTNDESEKAMVLMLSPRDRRVMGLPNAEGETRA